MLLQLPREILIQIFSQLSSHDLCSLRLTNHELHNLVHEEESTIVRKMLGPELEALKMSYNYDMPLSLDYSIRLTKRLEDCVGISNVLARQCCIKLRACQPFDEEDRWRKRKIHQLERKLMVGVLALYEFLERFRRDVVRSLHEFEDCSTADFARLGFVLGLDQQNILETFPEATLIHILQTWRILKGVIKSKGIPLICQATKYPYTTVRALLILGGLDRLRPLISKPTFEDRIRDLDAFNAEVWRGQIWKHHKSLNGPPLSSIYHLKAPETRVTSEDFPSNMAPTAAITFINRQQVCESSLQAVILRCDGSLDRVNTADDYILRLISEKGDPSHFLLPWSVPD